MLQALQGAHPRRQVSIVYGEARFPLKPKTETVPALLDSFSNQPAKGHRFLPFPFLQAHSWTPRWVPVIVFSIRLPAQGDGVPCSLRLPKPSSTTSKLLFSSSLAESGALPVVSGYA
jgi:hypothetical protein